MRVAHWGPADADALDQKEYSVRLMGGEALRMRLEAADLSAVSEQLRRERALVGHGHRQSAVYSITGMPLKIVGDGGGPSVQCQVSRVRISSWVTWAGTAGMSTGVGA
ncbi:hypothetical protein D3C73_1277330 [compost metagenome]